MVLVLSINTYRAVFAWPQQPAEGVAADARTFPRVVFGGGGALQVGKKVMEIQNAALGEHKLRDLNDEINKLIREKGHWEKRIVQLGGPNYAHARSQQAQHGDSIDGKGQGYQYFGAAKSLPGVKELFEKQVSLLMRAVVFLCRRTSISSKWALHTVNLSRERSTVLSTHLDDMLVHLLCAERCGQARCSERL
jgi:hypothetical protein